MTDAHAAVAMLKQLADVGTLLAQRIDALAARVDELEHELRKAIGEERVDRQNADESLERVIASRTDHLV